MCTTLKLTWKTSELVQVDEWPLQAEKLHALQNLVNEQLQAGRTDPSTSPWNSLVFVIQKRSGKWCLLHDIRKVNAVMEGMGALHPGLPSPTLISRNWHLTSIDFERLFFHNFSVPKGCTKICLFSAQFKYARTFAKILLDSFTTQACMCEFLKENVSHW